MDCSEKESLNNWGMTDLSVLAEVGPHAGAVSSSHQHMIDEEVCARDGADELSRDTIVVVAKVCDHIVKLKDLVAFMWVLKSRIKGHPWDRVVGGGADSSVTPKTQNTSPAQVCSVAWWPSWSWWTGLTRRSRWSRFPRSARLPLWALQ